MSLNEIWNQSSPFLVMHQQNGAEWALTVNSRSESSKNQRNFILPLLISVRRSPSKTFSLNHQFTLFKREGYKHQAQQTTENRKSQPTIHSYREPIKRGAIDCTEHQTKPHTEAHTATYRSARQPRRPNLQKTNRHDNSHSAYINLLLQHDYNTVLII